MACFWPQKIYHQSSKERPKTLLILNTEVNVSYTYIYKVDKNQQDNSFLTRLFQFRVLGCQSLSWRLRAPGGTPFHCLATHTHTCITRTETICKYRFTSLGRGRKPEFLKKTHADMGKTCKLYVDSGPSTELMLFPHQRYNEMTLSKMALFKDLLYTGPPFSHLQLLNTRMWCLCLACQY